MALHLSGFTTRQGNRKQSNLRASRSTKSCGSQGTVQVAGGNNGPTSCYPTLYTNPYEGIPHVEDMLQSAIDNPPNMETTPIPVIYEHQPQSVRLYLDSSSNDNNNPICSLILKPPTNTYDQNLNPNINNPGVDGTIAYFEKEIVAHQFEEGNMIVMELPNSTTALSSTSPYQSGDPSNPNLSAILYVVGNKHTMHAPGLKKALDGSVSYGAPEVVRNAVYSQIPLVLNGTIPTWSSCHGAFYKGSAENLWSKTQSHAH